MINDDDDSITFAIACVCCQLCYHVKFYFLKEIHIR